MPFASSSDLLSWLSQNLFLNPQQVEDLRAVAIDSPEPYAFCKELLRRDWLTPFQVNQILKDHAEQLIVGSNRLQSRLGEGAMGQIFKAWNVRLGRVVAVKMLHGEHILNTKAMDRFRREAQTAAQLDHPNIVLVRDADEANRSPYLVMDYIEGTDLSRRIKREGPMPVVQAAEFARQAALGLQQAHERGIVHRDIKPGNLIETRGSDGAPLIKILDFGLAKFEREMEGEKPLTQVGRLLGTVDYIAPEQAQDARTADIRADIYSLGCSLYYCLTGKPPFPGEDQVEKLSNRMSNPPPRVRDERPEVSPELDALIARMMAREPQDRFATPIEVAQALAPFCRERAPQPSPLPLAAPVLAAATVESPPDGSGMPLFFDDVSEHAGFASPDQHTIEETERALDHPDTDAALDSPRAATPPRRSPWPALVGLGGGLLLASLVAIAWLVLRTPAVTLGTMDVSLDSPPTTWKWGERKPVIVVVKRNNFKGPVSLQFEDLPPGVRSEKLILESGKDKGEMRITVSYQTTAFRGNVKLTASAAGAEPRSIEMPLIVLGPQP